MGGRGLEAERPSPPPRVLLTWRATVTASLAVLTSPSDPGTVGTPAAFMVSRAVDLSPIVRMCSERGPMNSMPWSAQMSTNVAFSERKP